MQERQLASLCVLSARFTFLFSIYPSDDDRTEVSEAYESTVFENHRKSLIQHCERSELRLHFEWPKVH